LFAGWLVNREATLGRVEQVNPNREEVKKRVSKQAQMKLLQCLPRSKTPTCSI
jgi:hypothetical protein